MSGVALAEPIVTESTKDSTINSNTNQNVTTNGSMDTKITQPPPSVISPSFSSGNNSDLGWTGDCY